MLLFRFALLSVSAVITSIVACSSPREASSELEILNGTPSDRQQVVLIANASDKRVCSGTLVAPDVVATASHCLGTLAQVYVGAE